MCCREEPVTLEEAQITGLVETVKISGVRERLRGLPDGQWYREVGNFIWATPHKVPALTDFFGARRALDLR